MSDRSFMENNGLSAQRQMDSLSPSSDLIEHYKGKLKNVDKEFDDMFNILQSYKKTFDCQHKLESEVQRSNKEIRELQSALSDMQLCLLEEKDAVSMLRRENEQLRVSAEAHPKNGNYILKPSTDRTSVSSQSASEATKKHSEEQRYNPAGSPLFDDPQETFYLKQIHTVKNQLHSQESLAKQQIDTLRRDRLLIKEEADACCLRDTTKLQVLQKRFKHLQDLLHDRTAECLQLRRHTLHCLSCDAPSGVKKSPAAVKRKTALKTRPMQRQRIAQPSIASVRKSVSSCRVDKEELLKQIRYFKGRCLEADERRKLEAEGFKNDIKELRSKLVKIENFLFKIANDYFGSTNDLAYLHVLNQSTNHAKKIAVDLRDVKTKLYSLENDLRHM